HLEKATGGMLAPARGAVRLWHSQARLPTARQYRRKTAHIKGLTGTCTKECQSFLEAAPVRPRTLVLGASETLHGLRHAARVVDDLGETHDGDDVVHRHRAA